MSSEYPLNFATSQAYSQPSLTPSLSTPPLPREYSSSDFRKSAVQSPKANSHYDSHESLRPAHHTELHMKQSQINMLTEKLRMADELSRSAATYEQQAAQLAVRVSELQREREEYRLRMEEIENEKDEMEGLMASQGRELKELEINYQTLKNKEQARALQLESEIETLKSKHLATCKAHFEEIENIRFQYEDQRRSQISREIKEQTMRFKNEKDSLENEIRLYKDKNDNKNRELVVLKKEIEELKERLMEMRNLEKEARSREESMRAMENEVERLNVKLEQYEDENKRASKKIYEMTIQMNEMAFWETENKNLKGQLDNKIRELESWRTKTAEFEQKNLVNAHLIDYSEQLTGQLENANQEILRVNSILKSKMEEISRYQQRLNEKEEEIKGYKHYEYQIDDLKGQIKLIKAENSKLNNLIGIKQGEVETKQGRINELEAFLSKIKILEKEKANLEDKLTKQVTSYSELEIRFSNLSSEASSFKAYEQKCRNIENQVKELNKENNSLRDMIKSKNKEIETYNDTINKLEYEAKQKIGLQKLLKDNEEKNGQLISEIDRLNAKIRAKCDECEDLENKNIQLNVKMNEYNSVQIQIHQANSMAETLRKNVANTKEELESCQGKINKMQVQIRDKDRQIRSIKDEKQQLQGVIRQRTYECEKKEKQLQQMASLSAKYEEMKELNSTLNQKILESFDMSHLLEMELNQVKRDYEQEKKDIQIFKKKSADRQSDLERTIKELKDKEMKDSNASSELKAHYSNLISRVRSKDIEIDKLHSKISSLESQCATIMTNFNELHRIVEQSLQESVEMQKRIETYRNYAANYPILGTEIDRLIAINEQLERDNKEMRFKYAHDIDFQIREQEANIKLFLMCVEIQHLRSKLEKREKNQQQIRNKILQDARNIN